MRKQYRWRGDHYEWRLEALGEGRYRLENGDEIEEWLAEALAPGVWLIQKGEILRRVHVYARGDECWVWVAGRVYPLSIARQRQLASAPTLDESGILPAEMPCQIVQLMVSVGDVVGEGTPLLLMEAMKMELRLSAPGRGFVREWLVTEGEVVPRGGGLLIFETVGVNPD